MYSQVELLEEVAHVYHAKVNWLLEFTDGDTQEAFILFKDISFGHSLLGPIFAASTVTALCLLFWANVVYRTNTYPAILGATLTFALAVPCLWAMVYFKTKRYKQLRICYPKYLALLENALMLLFTAVLVIVIVMRNLNGQCTRLDYLNIWFCNPVFNASALPVDTLLVLKAIPYICLTTLPGISMRAVLVCMMISVGLQAFCLYYVNAVYAITWAIALDVIMSMLVIIQRSTQIKFFIFMQKIMDLQRQRDIDSQNRQEGMTNLIGKLAHDLLTPVMSMDCGLIVLGQSLDDVARDLQSIQTTVDSRMPPSVADAQAILAGLQSAHTSLMITINRCTDYHKLESHMALVPRLSRTNVRNVLESVCAYAHTLQTYKIEDIDDDVEEKELVTGDKFRKVKDFYHSMDRLVVERTDFDGFMITDGTWLQDNLISMVSNALKFSSTQTKVLLRIARCWLVEKDSSEDKTESKMEDIIDNDGYPFYPYPSSVNSAPVPTPSSLYTDNLSHSPNIQTPLLRFEVEDFGLGVEIGANPEASGVDEQYSDDLFYPPDCSLYREMGGVGLGLYCLAERVKALKGRYGVIRKGTGHNGSVFWFAVPLLAHMNEDIEVHAGVNESHQDEGSKIQIDTSKSGERICMLHMTPGKKNIVPLHSPAKPHYHVLLIDDSPMILKMLGMMLERSKLYSVTTFTNGYEALAYLRKSLEGRESNKSVSDDKETDTVDILLVDIQMPIIDGLQVIGQCKSMLAGLLPSASESSTDLRCATPISPPLLIAMSANSDEFNMKAAYQAGADYFLKKPFTFQTLQDALKDCMKQKDDAVLASWSGES